MNRRDFTKTSLAGAALAALPARSWANAPGAGRRPNIVIVVADDLDWRDTGYQGSPYAITPNLDDMAGKGVRFDYHYAAGTVCCPNRHSILTGRTPSRAGYVHLSSQSSGRPRPREVLLPVLLKQAGYRTCPFGKSHISMEGFEKNVDSGNHRRQLVGGRQEGRRSVASRRRFLGGDHGCGDNPTPHPITCFSRAFTNAIAAVIFFAYDLQTLDLLSRGHCRLDESPTAAGY